jgi:predicted lipoprotein with Yx(FWY)xxD motif
MRYFAVTLLALVAAACAAPSGPFAYRNSILTNAEGRTLYVYSKDTAGKTTCIGGCAERWPPYIVTDEGNAGGVFGVIVRDDGRRQWAFNGQPLYFNATDFRPGDRKGGGVDGVWSVVKTQAPVVLPGTSDRGY